MVKWIDGVINGALTDNYTYQARERLGLEKPEPGLPKGGSPYMADDELPITKEDGV